MVIDLSDFFNQMEASTIGHLGPLALPNVWVRLVIKWEEDSAPIPLQPMVERTVPLWDWTEKPELVMEPSRDRLQILRQNALTS